MINIDREAAAILQANFTAGQRIVAVPLADDGNGHSESPKANIGEVVAVETREDGVYVVADIRDEEAAGRLGKTYLGASAFLHRDHEDYITREHLGPCLVHVAVTNNPYIPGLADWEELGPGEAAQVTAALEEARAAPQ